MRRVITAFAVMTLFLVAMPAVAMGQGNGATDEYEEELPSPGGNDGSDSNGGDASEDGTAPLTQEEVTGLDESTDAGATNAGSGQDGSDPDDAASAGGTDGSSSGGASADDDSGVTEVVGDLASGSDDGMGIVLPIVLVAAVVAAVGFLFARRRGRAGPA